MQLFSGYNAYLTLFQFSYCEPFPIETASGTEKKNINIM